MICALVPAAGESRRMGTRKALLPYAGSTIIGTLAARLLACPAVASVTVIAGDRPELLAGALSGLPVRVVENAAYREGMLSSIRCGLRHLPAECTAVLLAPGDQPDMEPGVVGCLADRMSASGKGILVPVWAGRRGHPLLFSRSYVPEILSRYDDVGLRGLLREHPDDVEEVEAPSAAVLQDLDTPEEYHRARAAAEACP